MQCAAREFRANCPCPKVYLGLGAAGRLVRVLRLELLPVGHFARLLRLLRADQVAGDQHIVRPDRRAHRLPRRPAGLVIAHAGWRRSGEGGVLRGADGRPERGRLHVRLWGPARGAIIVAIGAEAAGCRSGKRAFNRPFRPIACLRRGPFLVGAPRSGPGGPGKIIFTAYL